MDNAATSADSADALCPEAETERRVRLAREADGIAVADAEIAAGRLVESAKVKAWIDSIGTDHELPFRALAADPTARCRGI